MTSFADLHVPGEPLLLVNAWDVLSALALAADGHPAVGTTSLGITAAVGLPDGARAGLAHTMSLVRALHGRLGAYLTVDLEDGYSDDPAEVADVVAQLRELGVAGINLEDGKRSGAEHAAVIARVKQRVPDVFLNARTDVFWSGSRDADDALERLTAYRDAGADGLFIPGVTDRTTLARVVALGPPVNVLWRAEVDQAGDGVARISTGSALYRIALQAALDAAAYARDRGPRMPAGVSYVRTQELLQGE